jgi:hypothetical protein
MSNDKVSRAGGLVARCCKRQDGNISSPFYGDSYLPLMFGTVSRNPSRNDLSSFRNEISKDPWIFIVDIQLFIRAESTDLSPQERFFLSVRSWSFNRSLHPLLLS